MANTWDSLPNGYLINELLRSIHKIVDRPYFMAASSDKDFPPRSEAYNVILSSNREDIMAEWPSATEFLRVKNFLTWHRLSDAVIALIAWDEAGGLWKLNADQLRMTMQLLPNTDWRHNAAAMLLPLKEASDIVMAPRE